MDLKSVAGKSEGFVIESYSHFYQNYGHWVYGEGVVMSTQNDHAENFYYSLL